MCKRCFAESLKRDPEVQCLEDVICLVFLESYFAAFATQHDEAKILDILQRPGKRCRRAAMRWP